MIKHPHLVFAALLVVAACGGAQTPPPEGPGPVPSGSAVPSPSASGSVGAVPTASATGSGATSTPPPAPLGTTRPIVASEMGPALKELGLDINNLPPLGKIPPDKMRKVMSTFTKALGTKCTGCHDGDDFKKLTPHKKIAERMWNEFVRGYKLEGGGALYCDSCHGGKMEWLVRDPGLKELSKWMDENFVSKLKKTNGQAHSCETCHGDPMEGKFLSTWAK